MVTYIRYTRFLLSLGLLVALISITLERRLSKDSKKIRLEFEGCLHGVCVLPLKTSSGFSSATRYTLLIPNPSDHYKYYIGILIGF